MIMCTVGMVEFKASSWINMRFVLDITTENTDCSHCNWSWDACGKAFNGTNINCRFTHPFRAANECVETSSCEKLPELTGCDYNRAACWLSASQLFLVIIRAKRICSSDMSDVICHWMMTSWNVQSHQICSKLIRYGNLFARSTWTCLSGMSLRQKGERLMDPFITGCFFLCVRKGVVKLHILLKQFISFGKWLSPSDAVTSNKWPNNAHNFWKFKKPSKTTRTSNAL